jgi:hypothetical protein
LRNAFAQPQLIGRALAQSLTQGNLVWALIFPFLCLPLLKPRWLLIAAPVLLQHLLSWRSSEWTIYFHYSAPLLPLFWMALVEAVAMINAWGPIPTLARRAISLPVLGCVVAQTSLGPAGGIISATADWSGGTSDRARKKTFLDDIPSQASVLAPLPYLSHLAMREKLYSLHYVLKGFKTLSRTSYELPSPTDFVLIDYGDAATFDPVSGYYHPAMQTGDGRIIPSSDRLLHDFLKRRQWMVKECDALALLRRNDRVVQTGSGTSTGAGAETGLEVESHTTLVGIYRVGEVTSINQPFEIRLHWKFDGEREVFPWMLLRLTRHGQAHETILPKGLCAPETNAGTHEEVWRIAAASRLPEGDYAVEAIFVDNSKRAWLDVKGQADRRPGLLSNPIPLGSIKVQ